MAGGHIYVYVYIYIILQRVCIYGVILPESFSYGIR